MPAKCCRACILCAWKACQARSLAAVSFSKMPHASGSSYDVSAHADFLPLKTRSQDLHSMHRKQRLPHFSAAETESRPIGCRHKEMFCCSPKAHASRQSRFPELSWPMQRRDPIHALVDAGAVSRLSRSNPADTHHARSLLERRIRQMSRRHETCRF